MWVLRCLFSALEKAEQHKVHLFGFHQNGSSCVSLVIPIWKGQCYTSCSYKTFRQCEPLDVSSGIPYWQYQRGTHQIGMVSFPEAYMPVNYSVSVFTCTKFDNPPCQVSSVNEARALQSYNHATTASNLCHTNVSHSNTQQE